MPTPSTQANPLSRPPRPRPAVESDLPALPSLAQRCTAEEPSADEMLVLLHHPFDRRIEPDAPALR